MPVDKIKSSRHWLSKPFEDLVYKTSTENSSGANTYDVIIVGSGYGASMAAATLSQARKDGRKLKVAVLERGKEYLPGAFPDKLGKLARGIRYSTSDNSEIKGERDALFDLRLNQDINGIIANGLGGGSLINAGVMDRPNFAIFNHRWPTKIALNRNLKDYFLRAETLLGVNPTQNKNTKFDCEALAKFKALESLHLANTDETQFRSARITIANEGGPNQFGVNQPACIRCGDCAVGCNTGAKNSLDISVLYYAAKNGVEIYTGGSVESISPVEDEWQLKVNYTDKKLQQRQGSAITIQAKKVILAAGTYGSTEILFRSQSDQLPLSPELGKRFSGNGDMIALDVGRSTPSKSFAYEDVQCTDIGPTINGALKTQSSKFESGLTIEELAIPAPLSRLLQEVIATSKTFASLSEANLEAHQDGHPAQDPCAIDATEMDNTSIFALMCDDGAKGKLQPMPGAELGSLTASWPELKDGPLFNAQIEALKRLHKSANSQGQIIANPFWKLLPDSLQFLIEGKNGPGLTVHPLGGCAMADSGAQGVVNHIGQVFSGSGEEVYSSLAVLDGSIMASAIGTNPALTISGLALRAVEHLAQDWDLDLSPVQLHNTEEAIVNRPNVWEASNPAIDSKMVNWLMKRPPPPRQKTEAQVIERLGGKLNLTSKCGITNAFHVELTLVFSAFDLRALVSSVKPSLYLQKNAKDLSIHSVIRLIPNETYEQIKRSGKPYQAKEQLKEKAKVFSAPLTGKLEFMTREASSGRQRTRRALYAWALNRGLRDTWQWFRDSDKNVNSKNKSLFDALKVKLKDANQLASHAGEMRLMEYFLNIGEPDEIVNNLHFDQRYTLANTVIKGRKEISYVRRASPLRQLSELIILNFPHLERDKEHAPKLKLDLNFLSENSVPLLRLIRHDNLVQGYEDLIALTAYITRLLLRIHIWVFRKPDSPTIRPAVRLPEKIRSIPQFEIHELIVDKVDEKDIKVRATRYANSRSNKPPLVAIHGYSTSGNTYTHHAIGTSFVEYFWHKGREVWILDLRTSSGMSTGNQHWHFEHIAFIDLPAAVEFICTKTGSKKLDIFAHCMGSAMLSMSILGNKASAYNKAAEPYLNSLRALPKRINRLVLSQVAPLFNVSEGNQFRAYLLSHLKNLIQLGNFQFEKSDESSASELLLDRLLSAFPRDDLEYDLENPPLNFYRKTGFSGFRRRMDALYNRDFSLKNIPQSTLEYIEDLFGPLNIDTLYQTIAFARESTITNISGKNLYTAPKQFSTYWHFPTMSIHGEDNGLSDVSTVELMQREMNLSGVDYEYRVIPDHGHQDTLIGRHNVKTFQIAESFFDSERPQKLPKHLSECPWRLFLPWIGPVIGFAKESGDTAIMVGRSPSIRDIQYVLLLPVKFHQGRPILNKESLKISHAVHAEFDEDGIMKFIVKNGQLLTSPNRKFCVLLLQKLPETKVLDDKTFPELALALDKYIKTLSLPDILNMTAEFKASPPLSPPKLSFVHGSCQFPAGLMDQHVASWSYRHLASMLDKQDETGIDFMTLVGDQVYVDGSAELFDEQDLSVRYRKPYQKWLRQPELRSIFRRLPAHLMLDDHEISSDWDPTPYCADAQTHLEYGRRSFVRYQTTSNPNQVDKEGSPLWYSFQCKGFDFFMLDTRTEREHRTAINVGDAELLGKPQMATLLRWLFKQRNSDKPKFIASPSTLFPRHAFATASTANAIRSDGWTGYPASLSRLLNFIARYNITNVVFLCGDEHISCVSNVTLMSSTPSSQALKLYSIVSSAFYAPYPFANTDDWDLMTNEIVRYPHPTRKTESVNIEVETSFVNGNDGFSLIGVDVKSEGVFLTIDFEVRTTTQKQRFSFQMDGSNQVTLPS